MGDAAIGEFKQMSGLVKEYSKSTKDNLTSLCSWKLESWIYCWALVGQSRHVDVVAPGLGALECRVKPPVGPSH